MDAQIKNESSEARLTLLRYALTMHQAINISVRRLTEQALSDLPAEAKANGYSARNTRC